MITDGAAERLIETGRTSRPEKDGGFVLVFFALAIIALMGIAALVVDVGYWYLRGDQIQRAADAAALAGVVYMPGNAPLGSASNAATNEADSVLASNGFNPSDGNLTVSVTRYERSPPIQGFRDRQQCVHLLRQGFRTRQNHRDQDLDRRIPAPGTPRERRELVRDGQPGSGSG